MKLVEKIRRETDEAVEKSVQEGLEWFRNNFEEEALRCVARHGRSIVYPPTRPPAPPIPGLPKKVAKRLARLLRKDDMFSGFIIRARSYEYSRDRRCYGVEVSW